MFSYQCWVRGKLIRVIPIPLYYCGLAAWHGRHHYTICVRKFQLIMSISGVSIVYVCAADISNFLQIY